MKKTVVYRILIGVVILIVTVFLYNWLFFSCVDGSAKRNETKPDNHKTVSISDSLSSKREHADYLVSHYWDRFDFTDIGCIHQPQILEQAFAGYTQVLFSAGRDAAHSSISNMLSKAELESTGKVYTCFLEIAHKYLYDPNSPYRNEELYMPIAEYIASDKRSDEAGKARAAFRLEMMKKNRLDSIATDINYMSENGKRGSLHAIDTPYILLYFYNPDCHACKETTVFLKESPLINTLIKERKLTLLALYPDKDLDSWKKHLLDMPSFWINGYDKDRLIEKHKLYDLKAIPTLYLLDKQKRIVLKDASVSQIEEILVKHRQTVE